MASRTLRIVAACALAAMISVPAVACGRPGPAASAPPAPAAGQDHGHGQSPAAGPFDQLFRFSGSDFDAEPTFASLVQRSSLVVTARLEQVREGRGAGGAPPAAVEPSGGGHLIHVFTVSRVLRGDPAAPAPAPAAGDRLFVETPKPVVEPASVFDTARPPGGEAVLYLIPRPAEATATTPDAGAGLDPGATAMWPATPQGYLLLERGTVTHPMAATIPTSEIFPDERPDGHDLRTWLPADLRAGLG
jgi:hypothetical protein